jgi:hypothetical protein
MSSGETDITAHPFNAGIVHQNIDGAEGDKRLFNKLFQRFFIGDVGGNCRDTNRIEGEILRNLCKILF